MEFKYRAVDERPPIPTSQYPPHFSHNVFKADTDQQREMEKEKIREEILAGRIAQRRALEAEVLKELQMEGFEPLSLLFPSPSIIDQQSTLQRECSKDLAHLGWRKARSLAGFAAPESIKEKLIVLEKPDPSRCGVKRKSATPPVAGNSKLTFAGIKKPKEEWSCALCHVSATNERGLNDHLQGKKHRAKEAALRAEKAAKSLSTTQVQKKAANLFAGLEKAEANWIEPKSIKMDNGGEVKMEVKEHEGSKTDELSLKNKQQIMKLKRNEATKRERETPEFQKKKKFRFWCQMCQIGAYSEIVWESHRKGKKHLSLLQEHSQNGEAASNSVIQGSSVDSDKAEDSTAVAIADTKVVKDVSVNETEKVAVT